MLNLEGSRTFNLKMNRTRSPVPECTPELHQVYLPHYIFLKIHLFQKEREREGEHASGEWDREREFQADSPLKVEPDAALDSMTHEIMT